MIDITTLCKIMFHCDKCHKEEFFDEFLSATKNIINAPTREGWHFSFDKGVLLCDGCCKDSQVEELIC